jgi:hypothetical protein
MFTAIPVSRRLGIHFEDVMHYRQPTVKSLATLYFFPTIN